eukprot:6178594-Pleurochrysis_carterae.AAC.1
MATTVELQTICNSSFEPRSAENSQPKCSTDTYRTQHVHRTLRKKGSVPNSHVSSAKQNRKRKCPSKSNLLECSQRSLSSCVHWREVLH